MPLNPDIQLQIDKAKDFGAATSPSDAWKVIISFYTALHWMGAAYHHEQGAPLPNSHFGTEKALDAFNKLPSRLAGRYMTLRGLSQRARYEFDHTSVITATEVQRADRYCDEVRSWAEPILQAAGYMV